MVCNLAYEKIPFGKARPVHVFIGASRLEVSKTVDPPTTIELAFEKEADAIALASNLRHKKVTVSRSGLSVRIWSTRGKIQVELAADA